MKLGFVQPFGRGFEFEVAIRTSKRKCRMGKRKTRISRYCIGQQMHGFVQQSRIARGAKAVAAHEVRVCRLVPAISLRLRSLRAQRPVQCSRDLTGNVVLKFGEAGDIEVALPCEACSL